MKNFIKTATILTAGLLLSTNLYASYDGPVKIHFDSYQAMDAFPGGASEHMAKLVNAACRKLKTNEGIRKIGIEFIKSTEQGFYQTVAVVPISSINVQALVTIGNTEVIEHSVICHYEATKSEFNKETNQIIITEVNPNIRQKFYNEKSEKVWGAEFPEMYKATNDFMVKNATSFKIQDLPIFKRIDLNYNMTGAESMMGTYSSIVITNNDIMVKNLEGGGKKRISYLDVTRVTDEATLVYDKINNTEVNIQL